MWILSLFWFFTLCNYGYELYNKKLNLSIVGELVGVCV